jgi:hypothetical protein
MRGALLIVSFSGLTGMPLFKHGHLIPLDVMADNFMESSSIRKETSKSLLVLIDKVKSTQISKCIEPQWSKPRQNFMYISAELRRPYATVIFSHD